MIFKNKFSLIALAVTTGLLTGCGGAKTNIVEKDGQKVEEKKDEHQHDEVSKAGRLVVLTPGVSEVRVIDIDHDEVEVLQTEHALTNIHATENNRYAVLIGAESVEFVDGGIYQENHGDHLHPYQKEAELEAFHIENAKPAHVAVTDSSVTVFFDGNAKEAQNAAFYVFNEADIEHNHKDEIGHFNFDVAFHGAAEHRGEHVIASVKLPEDTGTYPERIGLFHKHDHEFEQESLFELTCPVLHGNAQNKDHVVFACKDGIAVIKQEGEKFTASKVAYSAELAADGRAWTLKSVKNSEQFLAYSGENVFTFDVEHQEFHKLEWNNAEAKAVGFGFTHDGDKAVLLDEKGLLSIYEPHNHDGEVHWELANSVQVGEHAEKVAYHVVVSESEEIAYVSDPVAKHILKIDLESAKITGEIELDVVPSRLTWLGIPGGPAEEH